eukprot:10914163-Heterocapsa_arctica.AAC.1
MAAKMPSISVSTSAAIEACAAGGVDEAMRAINDRGSNVSLLASGHGSHEGRVMNLNPDG